MSAGCIVLNTCDNFSVLRHIASGRREMRDEDADIDTAVGPSASAAAGGVRNVDDDLLLKAARSRRVARPSPATFLSADAGDGFFFICTELDNKFQLASHSLS